MCSQGFNRYPNDILKLSFSYAWGVISIWKWYLWKGVLGSPEKSGILTLLPCSCPHDIWEMTDLCTAVRVYTHACACVHICSQKARRGHRALFSTTSCPFLRRDLSLKPGTRVFLVSLDASQLQRSSWESGLWVCAGCSAGYVGADI